MGSLPYVPVRLPALDEPPSLLLPASSPGDPLSAAGAVALSFVVVPPASLAVAAPASLSDVAGVDVLLELQATRRRNGRVDNADSERVLMGKGSSGMA
jgi:hypothetical protein